MRKIRATDAAEPGAAWGAWLKGFTGVGLLFLAVLPGFFWPLYLRLASTFLFLALGLIVARGFLSAILSFKRAEDPPPKPDDVPWPSVSVVVPAYNEAEVLPEAMAALAQVDYPQDRIDFLYVYEKRSTDGTERIIKGWAERDARFVPVERDEPTGGKAAAANYGIARAHGELLVSLDADHAIEPGAIKRAARWFLSDERLACVKGRAVGKNAASSFLAMQAKVERDAIEKVDIYARQVFGGFTAFGGGQAIFRRDVFDRLGPMDESILVEDIDYSARIHAAGLGLRVDPGIRSWEENPPDLRGWWAQRMRWIRGWMQVAVRYLPRLHRMEKAPLRVRLDMAHTMFYALVPVIFGLLFPLQLMALLGYDTSTLLGGWTRYAWIAYGLAPITIAACVWLQDRSGEVRHPLREVPGLFTLWAYLVFQTLVFWSAFLDEFVLRRPSVYVKTAKIVKPARRAGRAKPVAAAARSR